VAIVALGGTAAIALAAPHFVPGATYAGKSYSGCLSGGIPGSTCRFVFHASANGRVLKPAGNKTVIDVWSCPGGGGIALFGGTVAGATPIPAIHVGKDGKLSGSVTTVLHPSSAPAEQYTVTVTGRLGRSGHKAVVVFHNHVSTSPLSCQIAPFTLHGG
jgi:hypothetical protein